MKLTPPIWILLAGILFQFLWLDQTSLWLDEGTSIERAESLRLALADTNGALYYALLYYWKKWVGLSWQTWGPHADAWVRALSALIQSLGFVVFWDICRRLPLSPVVRLGALLLYVFFPAHVFHGINVRFYSLWSLLNVLILHTLVRAASRTKLSAGTIALLTLWIALSLETQRYTAVFLPAYALFYFFLAQRLEDHPRSTPTWREASRATLQLFWPSLLLLALSAYRLRPSWSEALSYAAERASPILPEWGPLFPLGAFVFDHRYFYLLPHPAWHGLLGSLVLGLFLGGIWLFCRNTFPRQRAIGLAMGSLFLPVVVLTFLPVRSYPRLLLPFAPSLCIGLAATLTRPGVFRTLGVVLGCAFFCIGVSYKMRSQDDFRTALRAVNGSQIEDSLLIVVPAYARTTARLYTTNPFFAGFPYPSPSTPNGAEAHRAFRYIDVVYLIGHQPQDYVGLLGTLGQTHQRLTSTRIGGLVVEKYERLAGTPVLSKRAVCESYPDTCETLQAFGTL